MDQPEHIDLFAYLRGSLSPEEMHRIEQQLEQDPDFRSEMDIARQLYQRTEKPTLPSFSSSNRWESLADRLEIDRAISPEHPRPIRTLWTGIALRIAACVAILLSAGYLWMEYAPAEDRIVVYSEKSHDLKLPDGSAVEIDQATELSYTADGRDVQLAGRAYFEVARDEKHPFIITTEDAQVEVLGTRFQVDTRDRALSVYVTEGSVRVSQDDTEYILSAGQAVHRDAAGQWRHEEVGDPNLIAWHTGQLSFRGVPLADVVEQLSEQFGTRIRLSSPDLESCRFSAPLSQADLATYIEILKRTYTLHVDASVDGYTLSGGRCR